MILIIVLLFHKLFDFLALESYFYITFLLKINVFHTCILRHKFNSKSTGIGIIFPAISN